ncbi:hypothetical protein A3Q29_21150 [Providencia stuartii]|uniref:DNA internalization-related competence protein ComEC/Rec2 n=1 Tax=Providencia stuartii TaxID=588 RepID=A0A1S1HPX6_PROST|nr:hypothetical protein A3Q29_21150 [Providencia stuartii]
MSTYDLDFLAVGETTSGDAIFVRTKKDNNEVITLVDGGYAGEVDNIEAFMDKWYKKKVIDNMVLTHGDRDHLSGLVQILKDESIQVNTIWALFPWHYADDLINGNYFENRKSPKWLEDELKRQYDLLCEFEQLAINRGIKIKSPFQGQCIGEFKVLSPSKKFYLDNIASSHKTANENKERISGKALLKSTFSKVADMIERDWGYETFSSESTSSENNNSVIQYASIGGKKILLTGDAGVEALEEAIKYLQPQSLPIADIFQVPHHGSRRNLSSDTLDKIIGPKLATYSEAKNADKITAIISAGYKDPNHPRNAVLRALIHRGASVFGTRKGGYHKGHSSRNDWHPAKKYDYPKNTES